MYHARLIMPPPLYPEPRIPGTDAAAGRREGSRKKHTAGRETVKLKGVTCSSSFFQPAMFHVIGIPAAAAHKSILSSCGCPIN